MAGGGVPTPPKQALPGGGAPEPLLLARNIARSRAFPCEELHELSRQGPDRAPAERPVRAAARARETAAALGAGAGTARRPGREHMPDGARQLSRRGPRARSAAPRATPSGCPADAAHRRPCVHGTAYTGLMPENTVTVRQARAHLADHIDRAGEGVPTVITRNGAPVAAVVPISDFEAPEEAADVMPAREADAVLPRGRRRQEAHRPVGALPSPGRKPPGRLPDRRRRTRRPRRQGGRPAGRPPQSATPRPAPAPRHRRTFPDPPVSAGRTPRTRRSRPGCRAR
jgi:prevent-host-death family protein